MRPGSRIPFMLDYFNYIALPIVFIIYIGKIKPFCTKLLGIRTENSIMQIKIRHWLYHAGYLLAITSLTACGSTPQKYSYSAGSTDLVTTPARAEKIVRVAESMLGTPYKYGGISPKRGFDCSGLVYFSHRQNGITLPRTSHAQYRASKPVPRRALRRGDLLFFRVSSRKVSHVGIYLGNNRFVHAPSSGKKVSIGRLNSPYWKKRFVRGGRI